MILGTLETLVRQHFEPLQYAAFFGALAACLLAEALTAPAADRRRRARWPANWALTAVNVMLTGALPLSVIAAGDFALVRGWGLLNQPWVPPLAALATGFLLRSAASYAIHVAMHKLPVLWRIHRVHHTDRAMDVSTTVRFHPLEFAISLPLLVALALMLGIPPLALLLYELFDAVMAVFTHADIRLPARVERALRLVLVTPAMHRIHHSAWQPETDSNYGATFSIWDRLCGTFRTRPYREVAALRLGLDEWQDARTNSFAWLLRLPFSSGHHRSRGTAARVVSQSERSSA